MCACPAPPGGLRQIGSDPMKVVNDAVEESTNVLSAVLRFAASLVAPEEDKGTVTTHKRSPDSFSDELQITAVEECNVQVMDINLKICIYSLLSCRKSVCSEKKRFVLTHLSVVAFISRLQTNKRIHLAECFARAGLRFTL